MVGKKQEPEEILEYGCPSKFYYWFHATKEYFNDHYGACVAEKLPQNNYRCKCLKFGFDNKCSNWQPFPVSSFEELGEYQKTLRRIKND